MGKIVPIGKTAIVVHGGAGPDSELIVRNIPEYEKGLSDAVEAGHNVLKKGGSAVDAVEAAIRSLEDNPLFNAGRGAALTAAGTVEMCTSIMDGKTKKCGAAAIIKEVRNPISFAKTLLRDSELMYVGGDEAVETARQLGLEMEPDAYFITEHQWNAFEEARRKDPEGEVRAKSKSGTRPHGTVGAVALDSHGNIAAGTSTGGTEYAQPGRIGDSSMIGVGTYADNATAAISCTGDGEYLISNVLAHSISAVIEHTGCTPQEAVNHIIHGKLKETKGDLGTITVDAKGAIGIAFNSERMPRGWKTSDGKKEIHIYK